MEDSVPIIEITSENIEIMWPALKKAIAEASFIALDCELSGLGNRKKLNFKEIDLRYVHTKEITQEYSVVSLGISSFSCQSCLPLETDPTNKKCLIKSHNYLVQTFNILTLCSTKYTVECDSLKFLLSHGFDFNKQYSEGLPYVRGEDPEMQKKNNLSVKHIFQLIIRHSKPIVLHNGFLDLMFLYQSFYADLPKNSEMFAADLHEMFPCGIYDTKYISEYHQTFTATYLEYVFKRLQLTNEDRNRNGEWHCRFKFPPYPKNGIQGLRWHYYLQVFDSNSSTSDTSDQPLCESYKYHGWCSEATSCQMSHNIDRIARELHRPAKTKRRNCGNGVVSSLAQLINLKRQRKEVAVKQGGATPPETKGSVCDFGEHSFPGDVTNQVLNKGSVGRTRDEDVASGNQVLNKGSVGRIPDEDVASGYFEAKNLDCRSDKTKNSIERENSSYVNGSCSQPNVCPLESRTEWNTNCTIPPPSKDSTQKNSISALGKTSSGEDNKVCNGHSAGYDAFMTGFIFACDIAMLGHLPTLTAFQSSKAMNLEDIVGKVYLIGKGFPFLVRSSSYGTTSPTHDRLIKTLRT